MHWLVPWIRRPREIARLLAWVTVVVPILLVISPWLGDWTTYGVHDWDVETSHRYLTKLSLLTYGQAPFWNPYACGGFPAWGFIEGGTTLVSPWLPAYLTLPIPVALRVEVLGSGLLGAVGAFAIAGRFTRSLAARALVVALWAVDSRWSLQTAAGHTWHLLYAWMPWCLYFFERSREPRAGVRHTIALGVCLALIVYGGGIYPLPHVVIVLALYAFGLAAAERSIDPLRRLFAPGVLGLLLSAPKLLPMLHELGRTPRLIASTEVTSLRVFWLALTSRDQTLRPPVAGLPYGWHEYGVYVSVVGVVLLGLALVLVRGRRETVLKAIGLLFIVLSFGAFHAAAPWTWVHAHVPFFASQHVPSRFLYPAVLLLALVAASGLGRWVSGLERRDALAAAAVLALSLDIAIVARHSMLDSMHLGVPAISPADTFLHEQVAPFRAMPMYLAMLRNRGVIECYGVPRVDRMGARSVTDPRFRGDAVVTTPDGQTSGASARVVDWSPNRVVIESRGAAPGTTLVYDMNYDDGWRSDRGPVLDVDGAIGVRLTNENDRTTLVYWPRLLVPGCFLGGLGVLLGVALWMWRRRVSPVRGSGNRAILPPA